MDQVQTWGTQLLAVLRETVTALLTYLPAALTAAAVLLVGWLLAWLVSALANRALASMDWLFGRIAMRTAGARSRALSRATRRAVTSVVYWVILLIFAVAALRILGGTLVERWTEELIAYVPAAVAGVGIIIVGLLGGTFVRHLIEQAASGLGIANGALLARTAQVAVMLSGIVIGTDQLGVDVTLLIQIGTVAAGAVFGGLALVFALGTREHMTNLVAAHYARKRLSAGDYIRVGAFEGRILEIADGCIVMDTAEGDVSIPAHCLTREPIVKLERREMLRAASAEAP
ncbi:MAG TPA: hypothetical protein VF329_06725 [Gammaproteobacteria bacterium]